MVRNGTRPLNLFSLFLSSLLFGCLYIEKTKIIRLKYVVRSVWNPLNKYRQVQWYRHVTHSQSTKRIDCVYRQLVTVFPSFSPFLYMFKAFSVRNSHMHWHCFDWWRTINNRPDKVDNGFNDDVIATGHKLYTVRYSILMAISICYNRIGVYRISMGIYHFRISHSHLTRSDFLTIDQPKHEKKTFWYFIWKLYIIFKAR